MNSSQVIILVGLPGSGKTVLGRKFRERRFYDNFIDTFHDGQLISDLCTGKDVCVADSRLCVFDIYQYFRRLFRQHTSGEIKTILFANDVSSCLVNVKERKEKISYSRDIVNYSSQYYLRYYGTDCTTLPVYHSDLCKSEESDEESGNEIDSSVQTSGPPGPTGPMGCSGPQGPMGPQGIPGPPCPCYRRPTDPTNN